MKVVMVVRQMLGQGNKPLFSISFVSPSFYICPSEIMKSLDKFSGSLFVQLSNIICVSQMFKCHFVLRKWLVYTHRSFCEKGRICEYGARCRA
jgi:hypothetical protein